MGLLYPRINSSLEFVLCLKFKLSRFVNVFYRLSIMLTILTGSRTEVKKIIEFDM